MNLQDKSWPYIVGLAVGVVTLAFLVLAFQAWLLGIVLGWFGVSLGFWQCFLIAFLIGTLFGSTRSSN